MNESTSCALEMIVKAAFILGFKGCLVFSS